jgi:hypothetical protein
MSSCPTLHVAGLVLLGLTASIRAETIPGSAHALEALALCNAAAVEASVARQAELLDRGLAMAEEAVEMDDGDAAAHFAVFCNLGRRTRLRPVGLGSLAAIRRLRREIDRALELVPNSPDMLTAKGVMLLELPAILGGDTRQGERLLHQALEVAPGFDYARRVLAERGRTEGLVTTASR